MEAIFMDELAGIYTKGVKTKAQAVEVIRKEVQKEKDAYGEGWDDYCSFNPEDITMESVQETLYWNHLKCGDGSIGDDNVCYHCGESLNAKGRRTFAYFCPTLWPLIGIAAEIARREAEARIAGAVECTEAIYKVLTEPNNRERTRALTDVRVAARDFIGRIEKEG